MSIELDHTSVVLLGVWNTAIVTPPWLIQEEIVLDTEGGQMPSGRFSAGNILFSLAGLDWEVNSTRLIIKSEEGEDCGSYAAAILRKLMHTPIAAIGTNFAFRVELNEYPVQMLPALGQLRVARTGEESDIRKMRVQVSKSHGASGACNLSVDHTDDVVLVSYNIHRNVPNASGAAEYADGWETDRDYAIRDLYDTFGMDFTWPQP